MADTVSSLIRALESRAAATVAELDSLIGKAVAGEEVDVDRVWSLMRDAGWDIARVRQSIADRRFTSTKSFIPGFAPGM